ncbi:MAG TPA: hypothetical protein DEB35_08150 [Desulfuromonas sp.]|nr:hypothetical protein [Desulfuromonas sp.]HBT83375.1 hypothetical protein [Desulfuromonas sp.]
MSENDCSNPEKHCALHACQLKYSEVKAEVAKMFENPRFVCTNCGARVHDEENLCRPKAL